MTTLDELLALRGGDLAKVAEAIGADPSKREEVTGYQSLTDVEAIEAPDGVTIYARGDDVMLVYAGRATLPEGLTSDEISAAVGSEGEELRSRQGKTANMHVVADQGIAWSEKGGQVAFVEIFPATDLDTYQSTIYRDPGPFIR
jgi:hypothetical protein